MVQPLSFIIPKVMRRLWQYTTTVLGIIFCHPITGATIIPILPDGRIVLIRRHIE